MQTDHRSDGQKEKKVHYIIMPRYCDRDRRDCERGRDRCDRRDRCDDRDCDDCDDWCDDDTYCSEYCDDRCSYSCSDDCCDDSFASDCRRPNKVKVVLCRGKPGRRGKIGPRGFEGPPGCPGKNARISKRLLHELICKEVNKQICEYRRRHRIPFERGCRF